MRESQVGAKLNLDKSTILPLDEEPIPTWYVHTGCKVAHPGEVLTYLGSPVGYKISASKEVEFLFDKVCKRIFH